MERNNLKPISILLVEDNDDDIIIIERVFKKVKLANDIHVVRNGHDAIDYIYHRGKYEGTERHAPGMILLDISMPGMNGFDLLKKLKADPKTKSIPVVMLTSSGRDEDIMKSYENGACSYITKPLEFGDFVNAIRNFEIYWSLVSRIPCSDKID
jgi:CheY-like chemotaxis protein